MFASRDLVQNKDELFKFVFNEAFSVKLMYSSLMLNGFKPSWRSIWCKNKASPCSIRALFVILFAVCVSVLWNTGIIFSNIANFLKIFNKSFVDIWVIFDGKVPLMRRFLRCAN